MVIQPDGKPILSHMFPSEGAVSLTNRLLRTPASLALGSLARTKYRFDFLWLMYLSPGVGMFSYTEGLYLLPDGRIAVTSDIDRPWVIDRSDLRAETPIGQRDEWLPMLTGSAGDVLGRLFAGYNTSHAIQVVHQTGEVFLVNFLKKQSNGEHPVCLMRWDGEGAFERLAVYSYAVTGASSVLIDINLGLHGPALAGFFAMLPWVLGGIKPPTH